MIGAAQKSRTSSRARPSTEGTRARPAVADTVTAVAARSRTPPRTRRLSRVAPAAPTSMATPDPVVSTPILAADSPSWDQPRTTAV